MKRAAILYFTDRGQATAGRIQAALQGDWELTLHRPRGGERSVVGELFSSVDALIFVGACGIAVRAIAPFVRSKTTDPAVLVTDERGNLAASAAGLRAVENISIRLRDGKIGARVTEGYNGGEEKTGL